MQEPKIMSGVFGWWHLLELDQEIEITPLDGVPAGHGTEYLQALDRMAAARPS
ncbi:MAG: hypothetical protein WCO97_12250 [bacterium]